MNILYKDSQGKNREIEADFDMLPGFCAWQALYNWKHDGGCEDASENTLPVAMSEIIPKMIYYGIGCRVGTTLFIGDRRGWTADSVVLNNLPKEFEVEDCRGVMWYCTAEVSDYYENPNSGNDCRHAIIKTREQK